MDRNLTHQSISQAIVRVLTSIAPLWSQGQLTELACAQVRRLHPPTGEGGNWRHWRRARAREAKESLGAYLKDGRIRSFEVLNYFVQQIFHPKPFLSWSPGEPDPNPVVVTKQISQHLDQIQCRTIRHLKVYFVPRELHSAEVLAIPLFREPLVIAEQYDECPRHEQPVAALRVASLYLSILNSNSEVAKSWRLSEENVFGGLALVLPEAFVTKAGGKIALRTATRWKKEIFAELHARMKWAEQAYEVW